MIAYNETWLYNKYVRAQASDALEERYIGREAYDAIVKAKEVKFYTPNFFVRAGLGLLTFVIVVFAMSLVGLMMGASHSFPFVMLFIGAGCYASAELLISSKQHYNSGVDNMLIWMAAFLVWSGVVWNSVLSGPDLSGAWVSLAGLIVCAALAVRFADTLLSIAAAGALLCFVFFCYQHTGVVAKYTTPYVMMAVSGILYFVSARALKNEALLLYRNCVRCVNVVALVAFYGAGNYYLVRELSSELFHLNLRLQDALPMGWFFWMWTFLVPVLYLVMGVRNKNIILIRTGIPLLAVAVLTFRYYHSIMAPEVAMLLAGVMLIAVSWSLINYLKTPRNGFTFQPDNTAAQAPGIGNMLTKEFIDKAAGK